MLKVLMEFRKGILFIRLYGTLDKSTIDIFKKEVREVVINTGIKYVVLNIENIESISKSGIIEIKLLRKIIKKIDGMFFLIATDIKELKTLVNLENELNVFERVVI